MALPRISHPSIPIVNADGTPTKEFYEFILRVQNIKLADVSNVDPTAPTNGQVLTFVSATQKWKAS